MRLEDIGLKRKLSMSSEQPEKKLKVLSEATTTTDLYSEENASTTTALPKQILHQIPKDYNVGCVEKCEYEKRIHSDDDVPYYTFRLQFKVPAKYHSQSTQSFVSYNALAFQFDPTAEFKEKTKKLLNLSVLQERKWIVLPNVAEQSATSTQEQFYSSLMSFAKSWKQWRDTVNGEEVDKSFAHNHIEEGSNALVEFKRFIWPDEGCYISHLNCVGYNMLRRREKRRRSIVIEDQGLEDTIWSRYCIMEFADNTSSSNVLSLCAHDFITGVTRMKIQNAIIASGCVESQEDTSNNSDVSSSSNSSGSNIIERVTGRRYSVSSEIVPPGARRLSIGANTPSITSLL